MISKKSKIYIAGHNGMVGSAILRLLRKKKFRNIITSNRSELDLLDQKKVFLFFKKKKPDFVILAAARVGGIFSNIKNKPEFLYENLTIQNNVIHSSYKNNIKNLLFLGSSCAYPANNKKPIKEKDLLTGTLEQTNDAYAIAKISGIKMCEAYSKKYKLNYFCLMPSNMFGPKDNYDENNSHFFGSLIKKIHFAKINNLKNIIIWGNGLAKRELLYVDHFAEACLFFLNHKKYLGGKVINVGSHIELNIKDFAKFVMKQMKVNLKLKYDFTKPNGVSRKKLDLSLSRSLGWKKKFDFKKAFKITFEHYLKNEINKGK